MINRRLRIAHRASQVAFVAACLAVVANLIDHYQSAQGNSAGSSQRQQNLDKHRQLMASSEELLNHAREQEAEFKKGVAKAQSRLEAAEARQAEAK